jgi:hypothetical protein
LYLILNHLHVSSSFDGYNWRHAPHKSAFINNSIDWFSSKLCRIQGKISKQSQLSINLFLESLCTFDDIVTKSRDCVKVISRANLSSLWLTPMNEYNTSILSSLLKIASKISSHRSRIFTVERFVFNYKWQNIANTIVCILVYVHSVSYLTSSTSTILNSSTMNIVTFDYS